MTRRAVRHLPDELRQGKSQADHRAARCGKGGRGEVEPADRTVGEKAFTNGRFSASGPPRPTRRADGVEGMQKSPSLRRKTGVFSCVMCC